MLQTWTTTGSGLWLGMWLRASPLSRAVCAPCLCTRRGRAAVRLWPSPGLPREEAHYPAVLRVLCTNYLPNGKVEVLVSSFEGWSSVKEESAFQLDWDDVEGNSRRRLANLAHEKRRQEEARRKRLESKAPPVITPDVSKTGVRPPWG